MNAISPMRFMALGAAVLLMRGPITSVGPIAPQIRQSLDLSYLAFGFLTALPLLCLGVFCFAAPALTRFKSIQNSLKWVCLALLAGTSLRIVPEVFPLLLGTALIGAGIALLNTVMPVMMRHYFPSNQARTMGVYTAAVGFSNFLGPVTSVPMAKLGGSYTTTFLFWAVLAGMAFAFWVLPIGKDNLLRTKKNQSIQFSYLRKLDTWAVIVTMGLQSLIVYATVSWLPTLLITRGFDQATAGNALSMCVFLSVISSLLTDKMIRWCGSEGKLCLAMTAMLAAGTVLWVFGGWLSWLGCLLISVPMGTRFSLCMLLISRKSGNPSDMLTLSMLTQGIGYLIGALGPWCCGLLYSGNGVWTGDICFMLAATFIWGGISYYAFSDKCRVF